METKKCPYCGKTILAIAKACKHCGQSVIEINQPVEIEKENINDTITEFDVILKNVGTKKIQIVALIKKLTGLGLKEAKDLVDYAPQPIKKHLSTDEAISFKHQFENQGAEIELVKSGTQNSEYSFSMPVEDVFSIIGRGTIVTGRIQKGFISAGQQIQIIDNDATNIQAVCAGIEMFRKLLDTAKEGDSVGLLLRDVEKNRIKKGMLIVKSGDAVYQPIPQKKSGCFIATVCYGNYNAPEVLVLRAYRDNVLLKSILGAVFVKFYYFVSPPLARILEKCDKIKNLIKKYLLQPMVRRINKNYKLIF